MPLRAAFTSLPARGVWIEINFIHIQCHGFSRRSPHGECGLKCPNLDTWCANMLSLPARGVWIEIVWKNRPDICLSVAPRTGSVD